MRKTIIAGNWKMNKNPVEAVQFICEIRDNINTSEHDVVLCVPSVSLIPAWECVKNTNISIGAQNMYFEDEGAFTGEISAKMLNQVNINYVIIGHSERRQLFNETDDMINKKIIKALEYEITPILCVGETLQQRENNVTIEFVRMQVKNALANVSAENAKKIVIAYEPIWAIGTGRTATSQQAQEVCHEIRNVISQIYNQEIADQIRIQYGGSVNSKNASELFSMPDIDGGLVGGASLKEDFVSIVNYK